jgi:hypothetical protein
MADVHVSGFSIRRDISRMNALFREWVEYGQVIGQPSIRRSGSVGFLTDPTSLGEAWTGMPV